MKKETHILLTILCFSIGLAQLNGCKAKTTIEETSQNDDDSTSTTDTCTTVGQACTSGAIYAGEYDYTAANPSSPYKYSVIPMGCNGTTSNPACNGSDDQAVMMSFLDQSNQGNNDDVTTSFTNAQMLDGQLLTSTLANYNTVRYLQLRNIVKILLMVVSLIGTYQPKKNWDFYTLRLATNLKAITISRQVKKTQTRLGTLTCHMVVELLMLKPIATASDVFVVGINYL